MVHKTLALTALLCQAALLAAAGPITIKSVDQFNKLYKSDKPMVAMYTATWCGPCKSTKPHFIALAKEHPDITFCIIDFDKFETTLVKKAGIRGVPTFKFSHKGKTLSNKSGGMGKPALRKLITAFKAKCPKS